MAHTQIGPLLPARPAWVTALTLNRWAVLPASNTLADVNPDNDPACNPNHPAEAPWRLRTTTGLTWFGQFSNITDWCGAIADTDAQDLWWVDAGGHASMPDASSIKLQLDRATPVFIRVANPSGAKNRRPLTYVAEMARGTFSQDTERRMRSRHTVNMGFYWPGRGVGNVSDILLANSGGAESGVSRPYIINPATGDLAFRGANNANNGSGGWDAACFDPVRLGVWKKPTSSATNFTLWGGPDSNTWTSPTADYYALNGACSMCYVPTKDVFLFGNGGGFSFGGGFTRDASNVAASGQTIIGGWGVFDPTTGRLHGNGALRNLATQDAYPTFTGAPTSLMQGQASTNVWAGCCQPMWAASLGAALVWDNYGADRVSITRITPPASGDAKTGTWVVDTLPVDGGNTVTPDQAMDFGTYGRCAVFDKLGILYALPRNIAHPGFVFRYR